MNVPGIAELEATARGRMAPSVLAERLKAALVTEDPEVVARACEVLWMAAAYNRRAAFEREQFANVPSYQIAADFSLPLLLSESDLRMAATQLDRWLTPGHRQLSRAQRAVAAFDHARAELKAWDHTLASKCSGHLGGVPITPWYPGANYVEAPMRADGVITFGDEWELIQRLGQRIQGTVARVAEVTGCPRAHGNHAKATVLSAQLEADPRARPEWRALLGDTSMRGGLRLSNSAPTLHTVDNKGNLIGFRFSFMTDRSREPFTTPNADGGWFTLTANSAPGAHVQTPERHIAFTDSVGSPHASALATIGSVFAQSHGLVRNARNGLRTLREVARAIPQGKAVSARTTLPELVFHSRHAYRLGAQAVRYIVRVVEPAFPVPDDNVASDPDYRHRAVIAMVEHTEIVVTIGIQVLPDFVGPDAAEQTLYLIEDMRADWNGIVDEPFALVRIPRQSVRASSERDRMVRWFAENPVDLVNAGWVMAPLGAAGRSRTVVYEASREARSGSEPLGVPLRLRQ